MLYNYQDLSLIQDEIEFVDTAIIPVIDIDITNRRQENANNIELMQHVIYLLEKQLKGRLLITPLFSVINNDVSHVSDYGAQLKEFGFKHVVVLTVNPRDINDLELIKLNSIPLETMEPDVMQSLVKDEMTNVLKQIIQFWNQ
ncbi:MULTISPECIES: DUF2487 family protein [Nosocomiicoccus]|uniref:DUF2487 family protein n=1 Tax=Nosocomiicoccus massiliensis TaxID=1232430 RepID=A0AAF0YIK8_9STAP|nr:MULTISPECIES: DUF2487 family protein [Nosocomiicoccus]MDK6862696.1 DUF2487 family protein [Nosocomiicoccus ampullae]OFL46128.1 hypothetical protein HMPREF2767_04245 [Nosocomiicoccus sp. HMSC067E10]OFO55440.1 hypothetical protein HMPREF3029_04070 [Nosocomiicoccus sp. HMSC059G07]OFS64248.1 hypothetical protein HMPREF3177_01590 [Nosocomiicoccus sp. HMSC09A07]WOS96538.1 DUF2487 family protein [Nosocomiicoccus massiliensis]